MILYRNCGASAPIPVFKGEFALKASFFTHLLRLRSHIRRKPVDIVPEKFRVVFQWGNLY
jgi:hypothetical protein